MKTSKILPAMAVGFFISTAALGQSAEKQTKRDWFTNSFENTTANKANDYSFTKSSGTYTNLTGATSLNNNQLWDDPEFVVPIGFGFKLFDTTITSLETGGGLGALVTTKLDSNFQAKYGIAVFETDLIDRGDLSGTSQSPISYKVEGAAGSRIFKLEWKNAGFYDEADYYGTLDDYVNVQLWMYEGTHTIEVRFGPIQVTDPSVNYFGEPGAIVGVAAEDGSSMYLLSGDPANPIVKNTLVTLNGTPTDGTIYKFTKLISGINETRTNTLASGLYPNPFHKSAILKIKTDKLKNAELRIMDVSGRNVKIVKDINSTEITIDRDDLVDGVYFYYLTDEAGVTASGKFVIN